MEESLTMELHITADELLIVVISILLKWIAEYKKNSLGIYPCVVRIWHEKFQNKE